MICGLCFVCLVLLVVFWAMELLALGSNYTIQKFYNNIFNFGYKSESKNLVIEKYSTKESSSD